MPSFGLNAAFKLATNLVGARNDPYAGFNFLVEIEGLIVGGFSEITGLQVESETQDYREGGQNAYTHRLPGPMRYPQNLTLRRGLTDIDTLWSWQQEVARGKITRRNGTIYLLNRQGVPTMWWDFREAYPARWSGPELKADANAVAIETIELAHKGLSKPSTSDLVGNAIGAISGALGGSADIGF